MYRHILGLLLVAVCLVQLVASRQREDNGWQTLEDKMYNQDNEYVPSELEDARQQVAKHWESELIKRLQEEIHDHSSNSDYEIADSDFVYDDPVPEQAFEKDRIYDGTLDFGSEDMIYDDCLTEDD